MDQPSDPSDQQSNTEEVAQKFLKTVQDSVDVDDSIPSRNAIIAFYGNEPTFACPDNKGIVL